MPVITEQRASTVLYNFLLSNNDPRRYLLPANVCPIVPLTFLKAGQAFEFVDIAEETLCIHQGETLNRLRSGNYAGVLFVRTYGISASFEYFFSNVKAISKDLMIIDDRCLCPPIVSELESAADLVLFSTGYAKIVDLGFGGFGIIKPGFEYTRHILPFSCEDFKHLESSYKTAISNKSKYQYTDSAWLDTADLQMRREPYAHEIAKKLIDTLRHKKLINNIYQKELPLETQFRFDYQMWRFNIKVPCRDALLETIFANELFASAHYVSLAGIFSEGRCPIAETLQESVINLFNDFYITEKKALKLTEIVNEHLKDSALGSKEAKHYE